MNKIIKSDKIVAWDLGKLDGTPETEKNLDKLDEQIINEPNAHPDHEGESFTQFSDRVLHFMRHELDTAPKDTVFVTHDTVFGLVNLWNKAGRPEHIDKDFRKKYTERNSDTGDYFKIKGVNGDMYICRHGETVDNRRDYFRHPDTKLTEKGRKQAAQLGRDLSKVKIPEIVTSTLPRALETSAIIATYQNKPDLSQLKNKR